MHGRMLHLLPKVENQVGKVLAVALEVGGESPAVVTGGFRRGAYQDQLWWLPSGSGL
jgi:hypothetical protein